MIWHLARFDLGSVDAAARRHTETGVAGLEELDEVAWIRVARDPEEPGVTGSLTGFADVDALAACHVFPTLLS